MRTQVPHTDVSAGTHACVDGDDGLIGVSPPDDGLRDDFEPPTGSLRQNEKVSPSNSQISALGGDVRGGNITVGEIRVLTYSWAHNDTAMHPGNLCDSDSCYFDPFVVAW